MSNPTRDIICTHVDENGIRCGNEVRIQHHGKSKRTGQDLITYFSKCNYHLAMEQKERRSQELSTCVICGRVGTRKTIIMNRCPDCRGKKIDYNTLKAEEMEKAREHNEREKIDPTCDAFIRLALAISERCVPLKRLHNRDEDGCFMNGSRGD